MKPRIKVDGTFMAVGALLTVAFYFLPGIYFRNQTFELATFFLGVVCLLKGVFLRMFARGHKKSFSQQGHGLVKTGPYSLLRNPMYFGTFTTGLGFVLMLWPAWLWPIYVGIFYWRFIKQVRTEEQHLTQMFGQEYRDYCQQTPRFFPSVKRALTINVKEIFPWHEGWDTKEKRNIPVVLLIALVAEILQEKVLLGRVDGVLTLAVFIAAVALFGLILVFHYSRK